MLVKRISDSFLNMGANENLPPARKVLNKENLMSRLPRKGFEKLLHIPGVVYSNACTLWGACPGNTQGAPSLLPLTDSEAQHRQEMKARAEL